MRFECDSMQGLVLDRRNDDQYLNDKKTAHHLYVVPANDELLAWPYRGTYEAALTKGPSCVCQNWKPMDWKFRGPMSLTKIECDN